MWREGSLDQHIVASFGEIAASTEHDLLDPSIAAGTDVLLAVWREMPRTVDAEEQWVYARRFTPAGAPLDAQPLLVAHETGRAFLADAGTSVVFDGASFVVLWSGQGLRIARVTPAGALLDRDPLVIELPDGVYTSSSPRAVWTGFQLLVAWSHWISVSLGTGTLQSTHVDLARLFTRGTSLIAADARELFTANGAGPDLGLAWNGTHALVAARGNDGCVDVHLIDASLSTIAANPTLRCAGTPFNRNPHPTAAWSGSEFVVAWSDPDSVVRGLRLSRTLTPLDAAPVVLSPPHASAPELAPSPSGVTLGYTRIDSDFVPRAFLRTIERLGNERGRTVGH
jgi:hypothetical protein